MDAMTGMLLHRGGLSAMRQLRLRWPVPLGRAPQQARALHATGPAAEKKVHFDQIDGLFEELGIGKELMEQVGGIRVRQHVNPLKKDLQVPTQPLNWSEAYADPSLPLALDIGCGYGRFPLALSRVMPGHNMLGLEIREQCVDRAQKWSDALGFSGRVRYSKANATISLDTMLASYPGGLDLVTIQFPDPHFKRKHRKRRVVQPQLVAALARLVRSGGRVLLQSDVEEVAACMRDEFEECGAQAFRLSPLHTPDAVFFSQPAAAAAPPSTTASPGIEAAANHVDGTSSGSGDAQQTAGLGTRLYATAFSGASGSGVSWQEGSGGGTAVDGAGQPASSPASTAESSAAAEGNAEAAKAAAAAAAAAAAVAARRGRQVLTWAEGGWLRENPLGIPTEREVYTLEKGLPVYRVLLLRV